MKSKEKLPPPPGIRIREPFLPNPLQQPRKLDPDREVVRNPFKVPSVPPKEKSA